MKLKRYVLTDDQQIYDLTKLSYYKSIDGVNERYQIPSRNPYTSETESLNYRVIETSDNIIDLVEKGDMVEAKTGDEFVVVKVDKQNNFTIYTYNDFIQKHFITTIFKRQHNGDYKRYEVSKWRYN